MGAWKLCKPKLEDDIINQIIPDEWDPERVHFQGYYAAVNFGRFKANLANLRQKMATELDRAIQDDEAFQHDEDQAASFLAASHKPRWIIGSPEAPQERHGRGYKCQFETGNSPGNPSRICFCFDPKVFRKHVHQEKRSRLESPYWSKKKEDKNKKNKRPTVLRKMMNAHFFNPYISKSI
jgi:hypothetical protein